MIVRRRVRVLRNDGVGRDFGCAGGWAAFFEEFDEGQQLELQLSDEPLEESYRLTRDPDDPSRVVFNLIADDGPFEKPTGTHSGFRRMVERFPRAITTLYLAVEVIEDREES